MTETIIPEGSEVAVEPNGTAPATVEPNKKDRFVYVDDAATAERQAKHDAGENVSINSSIAPMLFDAVVRKARLNAAMQDDNNGRPGLKDGSISDLVREWAATYAEYTGDRVLQKPRETQALVKQVDNFKSATLMVFRSARGMIDAFQVPEDQVKAMQFAKVKETAAVMLLGTTVQIDDELLAELWAASAA